MRPGLLRARCHSASVSFVLETNSPLRGGGRPRVRFRLDVFDSIVEPLGHTTDAAKAEFLRVSPAALSKLRNGRHLPSADFIAAVRTALPAVPYERLFDEVKR